MIIEIIFSALPIIILTNEWKFLLIGFFGPYANIIIYLILINIKNIKLICHIMKTYKFIKNECDLCFENNYILTKNNKTCEVCTFKCCISCYMKHYNIKSTCPICRTQIKFK